MGWRAEDIHVEKSMHIRILHFLPNLGTNDIDLLLRVTQHAGEERIGEGFEALHYLEVVPGADVLLQFMYGRISTYVRSCGEENSPNGENLILMRTYQMLISGPHSHGPNALLDRDVRETGVFEPAFEEGPGAGF